MLCQNCKRNEASTHIRRIVNGTAAEYHLCPECADKLGYASSLGGLGLGLGELFGSFLGDIPISRLSNRVLRCEKCGCSFDDIVKSGKVGCADCYELYYDKLLPSLRKIHGQTVHVGKKPRGSEGETSRQSAPAADKTAELKQKLADAITEQNFELAAVLRDEIRRTEAEENEH
ncbi:MAG: UvrB/UvrC motif-containing protein [Clostridia bacterium]|nr:UvrB/UvrC motif-containing protein [Clostridia bacterium]MBR5426756.1 UvrB/UvrC motif-containing protein [Clostridia bacterium]